MPFLISGLPLFSAGTKSYKRESPRTKMGHLVAGFLNVWVDTGDLKDMTLEAHMETRHVRSIGWCCLTQRKQIMNQAYVVMFVRGREREVTVDFRYTCVGYLYFVILFGKANA